MTRFVLLLALTALGLSFPLASLGESSHDSFVCGGSRVEIFNSDDLANPNFVIQLSRASKRLKVLYSAEKEYLFLRCESSHNGPVLLVNHFCGGSGCAESNFGIIDPRRMKILLVPNKSLHGNNDRAERVIGHAIKPFSCAKPSHTSQGRQTNGAYCYSSPLELK